MKQVWNSFLLDDDKKYELFTFLAEKIANIETDKTVTLTNGEDIVFNANIDTSHLCPCKYGEVDTRMLLRVQHAVANDCKEVTICCTETNVVVLAVATFQQLGLEKLWIGLVGIKTSDGFQYMIFQTILELVELDSLSSMLSLDGTLYLHFAEGKKSAWQTWEVFPDATDVFTRLSKRPHSLLETDMEIIEAFVCIMYDHGTDTFTVNKARLELLARKQRSYDAIPPTLDALMEHTKRAVYQLGGHVWGQILECFQCLLKTTDFDLLGIKISQKYYIDTCKGLPMGCSLSCKVL